LSSSATAVFVMAIAYQVPTAAVKTQCKRGQVVRFWPLSAFSFIFSMERMSGGCSRSNYIVLRGHLKGNYYNN